MNKTASYMLLYRCV